MKYNSDNSDSESVKLPVASSPKDDFATLQRHNITLTPSALTFKMTESEPAKSLFKSKFGDLTKTSNYKCQSDQSTSQHAAKKPQVLFESPFSAEQEAKIDAQRAKAAVDFPNPIDETLKGLSLTTI
jgi:hypothetical protein